MRSCEGLVCSCEDLSSTQCSALHLRLHRGTRDRALHKALEKSPSRALSFEIRVHFRDRNKTRPNCFLRAVFQREGHHLHPPTVTGHSLQSNVYFKTFLLLHQNVLLIPLILSTLNDSSINLTNICSAFARHSFTYPNFQNSPLCSVISYKCTVFYE